MPNDDYFEQDNSPQPEVIEGLIREGQIGIFAGPFGVGKSPFLIDMAYRVMKGIDWFGHKVNQRPVAMIDFENSARAFRKSFVKLANRFGLGTPRVPDELEPYLEQGAMDDDYAIKLKGHVEQGTGLALLRDILSRHPNAMIMIDPIEMLMKVDTLKKRAVLDLIYPLRRILDEYPAACMWLIFNMRKKNQNNPNPTDTLTNVRAQLEEVCGSLDIVNRTDVRILMDIYSQDDEIKVINGIRRGEEFAPLFVSSWGDWPDDLAGFEQRWVEEFDVNNVLSPQQRTYWKVLPESFKFEDCADSLVPKSSLSRVLSRTKSIGAIYKTDEGIWVKRAGKIG